MPTFVIREPLDLYRARSGVRELASALGFPPRACEELAIVASELSSNIVKYGIRGSIEAAPAVRDDEVVGIMLAARDVGPRFHDFEIALQDGCDDKGPIDPAMFLRRGGFGTGLGAVARMTDSLELHYDEGGKRIVAVRYLRANKSRARAGAGSV